MLDQILVENPEPLKINFSDSLHEPNTPITSEQPPPYTPEDTVLPSPPMPLPLAAPPMPVNRRKSPAPKGPKPASKPAPLPGIDTSHILQQTEYGIPQAGANGNLQPPPSRLKTGITAQSPGSAYSPRLESGPANLPRTNQSSYPPLSALRARTPVLDVAQHEHTTSAPVSQTNFVSPLPRQPMSAKPLRVRDRSDSVKSKDSRASDSTRESTPYERPVVPRLNGLPPLRSSSRPGSAMTQRTPIAVAQHEGMI